MTKSQNQMFVERIIQLIEQKLDAKIKEIAALGNELDSLLYATKGSEEEAKAQTVFKNMLTIFKEIRPVLPAALDRYPLMRKRLQDLFEHYSKNIDIKITCEACPEDILNEQVRTTK